MAEHEKKIITSKHAESDTNSLVTQSLEINEKFSLVQISLKNGCLIQFTVRNVL